MSTKKTSDLSHENVLRDVHSEVDNSLITNGFLIGKVGRKIEQTITTTSVAGDTAILSFLENGVQLYEYTVIYTDATQQTMISAERTA